MFYWCLLVFSLFTGPLKIICEDPSIQSVTELRQVVETTEYGPSVVLYLQTWFQSWSERGILESCHLTPHEIHWAGWDLARYQCIEKKLVGST